VCPLSRAPKASRSLAAARTDSSKRAIASSIACTVSRRTPRRRARPSTRMSWLVVGRYSITSVASFALAALNTRHASGRSIRSAPLDIHCPPAVRELVHRPREARPDLHQRVDGGPKTRGRDQRGRIVFTRNSLRHEGSSRVFTRDGEVIRRLPLIGQASTFMAMLWKTSAEKWNRSLFQTD